MFLTVLRYKSRKNSAQKIFYFIGDFIEISYEIRKKPLQILMSEETLKADVSKYATVP